MTDAGRRRLRQLRTNTLFGDRPNSGRCDGRPVRGVGGAEDPGLPVRDHTLSHAVTRIVAEGSVPWTRPGSAVSRFGRDRVATPMPAAWVAAEGPTRCLRRRCRMRGPKHGSVGSAPSGRSCRMVRTSIASTFRNAKQDAARRTASSRIRIIEILAANRGASHLLRSLCHTFFTAIAIAAPRSTCGYDQQVLGRARVPS